MTKKLFLFCLALATALSLQAQTYRYLKVLTLKSSNHKWQELEWFSEGTAYPQPKMTSANSNGMRAYGDSGAGEAWQPYDGDPATHAWIGEINPPQTHSLILDLGESNGIRPDSLRITKPSYSLVYDFQVWASNDENSWALLLNARDLASDGHSQMTFPLAEIPDTARPSSPQNLVLHRATLTSLNIGWDVSTDDRELDHYVVYLDDTAVDSTSENNRLITGLDTATVYSCFVVAVDNAGNRSEKSEVMDFSTKEVDLLPPSDPAGLTLEESRYDLLQMSWSPSTDNDELSGYIVYMNNQIVGATSDTVFAVPGLIPQSSFDFKVYAKDLSGNLSEGYASGSFATTGDVPGKMLIGTNFWNISWGGSGNDPFINGYQNVTGDNPWKPVFLDDVSFYSHYRFMDWLEINNSTLSVWMDRKQKTDINQKPMAFEWLIDLGNRENRDVWIPVPHKVVSRDGMEGGSNHFVRKLAILLKTGVDMLDIDLDQDQFGNLAELTAADLQALGGRKTCEPLKPGLKVYIEYSNETWNYLFDQAEHCHQEGMALGLPGDEYAAGREFHAWAALKIFQAMEDVFGPDSPRLVKIDAYQAVVPSQITDHLKIYESPEYNPDGLYPDAFSPAPYFGNNVNGSDPDMKSQLVSAIKDRTNAVKTARRFLDNATGKGDPEFKLIAYEAGQHILTNADAGNRKEVMYELYVQYLDSMNNYLDEMSHYLHSGSFSSGGAWGAREYIGQPMEEAHKFRAIYEWVHGTATRPDTEAPTIPQNLTASDRQETSFHIQWTEASDNDAVSSYLVYINGEEYAEITANQTNISGLKPGRTYRVTVAAVDAAGNISQISDYLDVTTLGSASFNVTFIVGNGTNPLEGANVSFNAQDALTDAAGMAVFEDQQAGSDIPYEVTKDHFERVTGTVSLINNDPVIEITMSESTGLTGLYSDGILIYPNPAGNVVFVKSANAFEAIILSDISGRILRKINADTNSLYLNIQNLDDGTYFLQIEMTDGRRETRKILVKN